MKHIPLTRGAHAIVDDDDYEMIMSMGKWHLSDTGYAVRRSLVEGVKRTIRMHRVIAKTPDGLVTDHINHSPLDNRKSNLRSCTQSVNSRNKTIQGRGYWFNKRNGRWVAEVNTVYIGSFTTETKAKEVADRARKHGIYEPPTKTHCKWGHPLADAYDYGLGARCRPCQSLRSKEYWKRKNESTGKA